MALTLNDKNRSETKPLTVEEEQKLIELLNEIVACVPKQFQDDCEDIIQRLINNYQNLQHYKAVTSNYDLLLKKVESQEKEISNLTIDLNNCVESLQRECKSNEALISHIKDADAQIYMGRITAAKKYLQKAIENNK